ncbi:MAG: SAM-dependent methyltransferase [Anaerolineales bacterium]
MKKRRTEGRVSSSFRDPSGFLFYRDGEIYRQVNAVYGENYTHLMDSGLYEALVKDGLLIPHEEVDVAGPEPDPAFKVIRPERLPFISYPYEWCFSQLKDAALTTLKIQERAFEFGMSLKDASAYNIQFREGSPILIDTLSFEKYREGEPWVAYRQFCQHFLAPLALMSYRDVRLNQLLRVHIDGVPLDLASSLLPLRTCFVFSLLSHIHLHARAQKRFADKTVDTERREMGRLSFRGLVDGLKSAVERLTWAPRGTEWADYYEETNYPPKALQHKKGLVAQFLSEIEPESVWDLGANVGLFSRLASERGIHTLSFDVDPAAVERNYLRCVKEEENHILPLFLDLTNPSPGIGWENEERASLLERGPADTVFALALIHHLAISNNLPLDRIAGFFSRICRSLVIEFVPKGDSQVQRLLSTREDIFFHYTQQHFEDAFSEYFIIRCSEKLKGTERSLYLMEGKRAS